MIPSVTVRVLGLRRFSIAGRRYRGDVEAAVDAILAAGEGVVLERGRERLTFEPAEPRGRKRAA